MSIEIEGLRLSIGATAILHDVRLTLPRGKIYGLIGPNGAGKSTTIAATLGLRKRAAGRVAVFGRDPEREPAAVRASAGVLLEQNGLYDWMTAVDYMTFFTRLHRREPGTITIRRCLDASG